MKIIRHIVGIASVLFTFKDPYDEPYAPPRIVSETRNGCDEVVSQIVRADNHADATRHLQGTTIQGNRSIVATRAGRKTWNVHTEDWNPKRVR
jgi:hypothetical protein